MRSTPTSVAPRSVTAVSKTESTPISKRWGILSIDRSRTASRRRSRTTTTWRGGLSRSDAVTCKLIPSGVIDVGDPVHGISYITVAAIVDSWSSVMELTVDRAKGMPRAEDALGVRERPVVEQGDEATA
jgi:hypothetical protein